MKKGILFVSILLIITGCAEKIDYKKVMEEYAKDYYENYMKGVQGQDKNEVSIKLLKNANKTLNKKYDLSKLTNCKDDSYVSVIVDNDTRKIKKYEFHLNCK